MILTGHHTQGDNSQHPEYLGSLTEKILLYVVSRLEKLSKRGVERGFKTTFGSEAESHEQEGRKVGRGKNLISF